MRTKRPVQFPGWGWTPGWGWRSQRFLVQMALSWVLILLLPLMAQAITASGATPTSARVIVAQHQAPATEPLENDNPLDSVESATVVLDGENLFTIEASIPSRTRSQRAREISENIKRFADNRSISLDAIRVKSLSNGSSSEIWAGNQFLMAVYKVDAEFLDDEVPQVAQQYAERIHQTVAQYRVLYSPEQALLGLLKTAIATGILMLAIWAINRGFRILRDRFRPIINHRLRNVRIGSRDFISTEQIRQFLLQVASLIRAIVVLSLISLYLNTVLTFFPQTRSISAGIFASMLSAISQVLQGFFAYLPKLLFLIVLGYITLNLLKFSRFLFQEIDQGDLSIPGFDRDWAIPTSRISQILILALAAVIAFPYLPGSGSEAFQGISIFLGVLISLGSSSAIANVIAGILLTYTRAFRIGDEVDIAGVEGTVVEKGLLVVRILDSQHRFVSIPNSQVLSSNVINYRSGHSLSYDSNPPPIIQMQVGFGYETAWQQAYSILLEAARETSAVLHNPSPLVLHRALKDFYIVYELNVYTHQPQQRDAIRSELYQKILDRCYATGIELVAPQVVAVRYDTSSLPEQALQSDRPSQRRNGYPSFAKTETATTETADDNR